VFFRHDKTFVNKTAMFRVMDVARDTQPEHTLPPGML